MSLRSIFSSEYFVNIQQQSFMANNKAVMKYMQNEFQFGLVWVLMKAALGHPRFYNFSIGITFLPYKSTMLSLCGPPRLECFPKLLHVHAKYKHTCSSHNTYIITIL